MTPLQKRVVDFIVQWKFDHGFSPSVREVAEGLGKTAFSIGQQVALLRKKGIIVGPAKRARAMEVVLP